MERLKMPISKKKKNILHSTFKNLCEDKKALKNILKNKSNHKLRDDALVFFSQRKLLPLDLKQKIEAEWYGGSTKPNIEIQAMCLALVAV